MKPFFQTWFFQIFAPYLYTYIKYRATGQWDQIEGQTKQKVIADPNQWPSLLTMEIILATIMVMVIDLCLSATALLARANGEGSSSPVWEIAERVADGLYNMCLTWYAWLVAKNILLMILQYVLFSYERDRSVIRQRFSFVSAVVATISIALLFRQILGNVSYGPDISGEDIKQAVLSVELISGLTLVILSTSVFNQYGLGFSRR